MSNIQILRPKELCSMLSISIPTLYRWESEGKLPLKKIKLGPNSVGFLRSDVESWILKKSETLTDIA